MKFRIEHRALSLGLSAARTPRVRAVIAVAISLALLTTSHAQDRSMNSLAEQYVRLVLAVGQHDADYVDAYYGPPEWRKEAEAQKLPLTEVLPIPEVSEKKIEAAEEKEKQEA